MSLPVKIPDAPTRFCKIFENGDKRIPDSLKNAHCETPDLSAIDFPLPVKKSDINSLVRENGIFWLGSPFGLTRLDTQTGREADRVMYFSAPRDLPDNRVRTMLLADGGLWVLTDTGASFIEIEYISAEKKADMLLGETVRYVSRRGMVSQKGLSIPRVLESALPYNHSDNDGCFTAGFAMGELFRYATLRREKGSAAPETQEAKNIAVRACEACLLLMYITGRGDGFVARTYLTPHEPLPDDGLFYRKEGGVATCLETHSSVRRGLVGVSIKADAPVPDRLARLYRDEGFSDDGIIYKGDTSSDEITLHFMLIYFICKILGDEDDELCELAKAAAKSTLSHILENGRELHEYPDRATTWAKWSREYFSTMMGWSDACLNSAELLMYIKIVINITGETKWQSAYDELIAEGYGDIAARHAERFQMSAMTQRCEEVEDLMYGDHMLATAAYWLLCELEADEKQKIHWQNAYRAWNKTFRREHNPAYDFPFYLACRDDVDGEKIIDWFRRTPPSRLAAGVSLDTRTDITRRVRFGGGREVGVLLPPDERFISKLDRNPYAWQHEDSGGIHCIESCYHYTFPYWLGRYYKLIEI